MIEPQTLTGPFGVLLRSLREAAGYSRIELARRAEVDASYVGVLERSPRTPLRRVVFALCAAMRAGPDDRERLLVAAGLCPETIVSAGGWEAYLADRAASTERAIAGNVAALTRKLELARAEIDRQATLNARLRRSLGTGELVRLP